MLFSLKKVSLKLFIHGFLKKTYRFSNLLERKNHNMHIFKPNVSFYFCYMSFKSGIPLPCGKPSASTSIRSTSHQTPNIPQVINLKTFGKSVMEIVNVQTPIAMYDPLPCDNTNLSMPRAPTKNEMRNATSLENL